MTYPRIRKCCVPGCSSRSDTDPHLLFYLVPSRISNRRKLWLKLIGIKKGLRISRYWFVCQKHFEKRFISAENKRMKYGYPTLFTQEEIETGRSKKFSGNSFKHRGLLSDHSYCQTPDGPMVGFDHSYSFQLKSSYQAVLNEYGGEVDAEEEEKYSQENEKIAQPMRRKQPTKRKKSITWPLYYINDNKENSTEDNNHPNIPNIIINNAVENNSTTPNFTIVNNNSNVINSSTNINNTISNVIKIDKELVDEKSLLLKILLHNNSTNINNPNPENITLGNNPINNNSSLLKLLIDNKLIDNIAVDNNTTVNDEIYNDDDDDCDSKMVIDQTSDYADNVDNNTVTDNDVVVGDNVVIDNNAVIENIVENNLTNEQILENIMKEINNIKSRLSDTIKTTNIVGCNKELTEKLDVNDMALVNYNNTVVLCRKSDVAKLKNNYPELVANGQTDQNLVTQVKRHKMIRRRRRRKAGEVPTELKKQQLAKNTTETVVTEDEAAVKHILCACDANTPCEHRNPPSNVLFLCEVCKEEHPVNYWSCKRNENPSPDKTPLKRKKVNPEKRRRYITVEQFDQVNNDIQKLMSTTQQIQGQINSLTTVLTSLVTAVGKIEKEREEIKKPKPRKPRKKKEKESLPIL